jgi:hypothetical protein
MRILGTSPWLAAVLALIATTGNAAVVQVRPAVVATVPEKAITIPAVQAPADKKVAAPNGTRPPWARSSYKRFV